MTLPVARALPLVVAAGVAYSAIGLVSAAFAAQAASHQAVVGWRWAAWVASAVVFGAHVAYEQVRLRSSTTMTALRVAAAVGLGAFGLAAAANIHRQMAAPDGHPVGLILSLALWPILTGLPAFVVALVAAALLARARRT